MYNIVLLGDKRDRQLSRALLPVLRESFQVNYISFGNLQTFGQGEQLNFIEMSELHEIALENCILILKQNARTTPLRLLDRSIRVILSGANTKSMAQLARFLPEVYTCGFSAKESITFSSREEEDLVVSLQRSVSLGAGNLCEPFEIPCHRAKQVEDYTVLASVLALILIGSLDENKTKDFGRIYFS